MLRDWLLTVSILSCFYRYSAGLPRREIGPGNRVIVLKNGVDAAPDCAERSTPNPPSRKATLRCTVCTGRIAELIMRRDIGRAAGVCRQYHLAYFRRSVYDRLFCAIVRRLLFNVRRIFAIDNYTH